jgi:hypothetical protein
MEYMIENRQFIVYGKKMFISEIHGNLIKIRDRSRPDNVNTNIFDLEQKKFLFEEWKYDISISVMVREKSGNSYWFLLEVIEFNQKKYLLNALDPTLNPEDEEGYYCFRRNIFFAKYGFIFKEWQ